MIYQRNILRLQTKDGKSIDIRIALSLVFLLSAAVLCLFLRHYNSDKDVTPPVISVLNNTMEYTEGDDEQSLYKGVRAKDDVDGDVSESIRVRTIYHTEGAEEAIVTYIAKDASNNVGTARRVVIIHNGQTEPASDDENTNEEESAEESINESEATDANETESEAAGDNTNKTEGADETNKEPESEKKNQDKKSGSGN